DAHFLSEIIGVGSCILQVVTFVSVGVQTDCDQIRGRRTFEAGRAVYDQPRIATLDVVAAEGIDSQFIATGNDGDGGFQNCRATFALQSIAAPNLDQRAVPE